MTGLDVSDPDLTYIDLDQTSHVGGSGTLVSDKELVCTSGMIYKQIVAASGAAVQSAIDATIGSLPDAVSEVQGIFNFPFAALPLRGDDSAGTPLTTNGFPVLRLNKNSSDFITWTRRAPAAGASGLVFQMAWTPDGNSAGNVRFRLTFNSYSSGIFLTGTNPKITTLDLAAPPHGGSWDGGRVYINDITPSGGSLNPFDTFNLKIQYLGVESAMNKNIYVLNCAMNFRDSM